MAQQRAQRQACFGSARAGRMRSSCRGKWTRTPISSRSGNGALAGSAEREREAAEQGSAFAATVSALTGETVPLLPYPVAVGAAARQLKLPAHRVAASYLQGFAGNLVSAAVRLVPLGQTEGQGVLAALRPTLAEVAAKAACTPLAAIGLAAFGAELAAMHHETMSPRMFRT